MHPQRYAPNPVPTWVYFAAGGLAITAAAVGGLVLYRRRSDDSESSSGGAPGEPPSFGSTVPQLRPRPQAVTQLAMPTSQAAAVRAAGREWARAQQEAAATEGGTGTGTAAAVDPCAGLTGKRKLVLDALRGLELMPSAKQAEVMALAQRLGGPALEGDFDELAERSLEGMLEIPVPGGTPVLVPDATAPVQCPFLGPELDLLYDQLDSAVSSLGLRAVTTDRVLRLMARGAVLDLAELVPGGELLGALGGGGSRSRRERIKERRRRVSRRRKEKRRRVRARRKRRRERIRRRRRR